MLSTLEHAAGKEAEQTAKQETVTACMVLKRKQSVIFVISFSYTIRFYGNYIVEAASIGGMPNAYGYVHETSQEFYDQKRFSLQGSGIMWT